MLVDLHTSSRNIGSVRNMLSDDACSQLIHALVTVRIDYCNSLLYGLPEYSLDRLQKILKTAARVLRRVKKFDHITETLMDLHWMLDAVPLKADQLDSLKKFCILSENVIFHE